ncbi:MAG: hypothetical protein ACOZCL_15790 [Bacillota bacterium]
MIILFGGLITLFIAVIGIILYVLLAVGLYGMAKNAGIGNEWFAFIPILQMYIIGKILKEVKIANYTVPQLELVLPLAPIAVSIAGYILGIIPVLGDLVALLLNIAYLIFNIIVLYNLYKKYKGEGAVLMTVLSVILFFMMPIYIFTLRNSTPIE